MFKSKNSVFPGTLYTAQQAARDATHGLVDSDGVVEQLQEQLDNANAFVARLFGVLYETNVISTSDAEEILGPEWEECLNGK